jgi:threonine dehydratase
MITQLMTQHTVQKLICSSGGNAGLAVATAAKKVALPVDVYVPTSTKVG